MLRYSLDGCEQRLVFLGRKAGAIILSIMICVAASAQVKTTPPPTPAPTTITPTSQSDQKKVLTPKYLTLGKTVRGREITAIVYGSGSKRVLVFGGIHGNEPHTTVLARSLAVNMSSDTLPESVTLIIVPDVNPDGLMASTRVNANGVDINRNFPSKTWRAEYSDMQRYPGAKPSSEPETRAVLGLLEKYPPHFVVTLHAALGCVNWDGPGDKLAEALATSNGYPLCGFLGYETPGSLGIFTGIDHKIPTVTIELRAKNATALVAENLPGLLALLKHIGKK